MSRLRAIASEEGVPIDTAAEIDVRTLTPADGLLVLHPQNELPARALTEFLRRGGRLAVADDFGSATSFLDVFSIRRHAPPPEAEQLRGNPNLLIAHPLLRHPIAEDVPHLVTNHPQVVAHHELTAVFGFDAEGHGTVLSGAVEEGRLVAIGDPSIFINNMLDFRGNERFARNLLRYLHAQSETSDGSPQEMGGRVFIATPETRLVGTDITDRKDATRRLDEWLEDAAGADLPPAALTAVSLTLLTLLLLFVFATLPRRRPYGNGTIPPHDGGGGVAGRIAYALTHDAGRAHACLVYRVELREALAAATSLPAHSSDDALVSEARRHGLGEADAEELRRLLRSLAQLVAQIDRPPGTPKVSARAVQRMVQTGERMLSRVNSGESL